MNILTSKNETFQGYSFNKIQEPITPERDFEQFLQYHGTAHGIDSTTDDIINNIHNSITPISPPIYNSVSDNTWLPKSNSDGDSRAKFRLFLRQKVLDRIRIREENAKRRGHIPYTNPEINTSLSSQYASESSYSYSDLLLTPLSATAGTTSSTPSSSSSSPSCTLYSSNHSINSPTATSDTFCFLEPVRIGKDWSKMKKLPYAKSLIKKRPIQGHEHEQDAIEESVNDYKKTRKSSYQKKEMRPKLKKIKGPSHEKISDTISPPVCRKVQESNIHKPVMGDESDFDLNILNFMSDSFSPNMNGLSHLHSFIHEQFIQSNNHQQNHLKYQKQPNKPHHQSSQDQIQQNSNRQIISQNHNPQSPHILTSNQLSLLENMYMTQEQSNFSFESYSQLFSQMDPCFDIAVNNLKSSHPLTSHSNDTSLASNTGPHSNTSLFRGSSLDFLDNLMGPILNDHHESYPPFPNKTLIPPSSSSQCSNNNSDHTNHKSSLLMKALSTKKLFRGTSLEFLDALLFPNTTTTMTTTTSAFPYATSTSNSECTSSSTSCSNPLEQRITSLPPNMQPTPTYQVNNFVKSSSDYDFLEWIDF